MSNKTKIATVVTKSASILNNPTGCSTHDLNSALQKIRRNKTLKEKFFEPKGLDSESAEGWKALKNAVKTGEIKGIVKFAKTEPKAQSQKKSNAKPKSSKAPAHTQAPASAQNKDIANRVARLIDLFDEGKISDYAFETALKALATK